MKLHGMIATDVLPPLIILFLILISIPPPMNPLRAPLAE